MTKKLLPFTAVFVVVSLCGSALALDPMGPPTAGLNKGQFSAGFEYAFGEMDLEIDNDITGTTGKGMLDDVKTNKYYATVGYGISDDWEIYTRLGAADIDFDADSGNYDDFNGDTDFAFAVGTRKTFVNEVDVKWGALLQVAWMQSEDKLDSRGGYFGDGSLYVGSNGTMDVEIYEIQLAVGPTVKISGGDSIYLYGGPFLHILDGDIDAVYTEELSTHYQYDLEEDVQFGGYLGALLDLSHNISATIEGQMTTEAYLLAAGVNVKF